jgi:hypothetical protein
MPAASSSLTDPAIGQLLTAAQGLGAERARLLAVLAAVPDPRAHRGVRHELAVILSLALWLTGSHCWVWLAGCGPVRLAMMRAIA